MEESMIKEYQISGIHPVKEALKLEKTFTKVLIQRGLINPDISGIIQILKEKEIPVQYAPKVKLDKTSKINHQGIIGFTSPIEFCELDDILEEAIGKKEAPLILILDGITDTRNFGAICRTAECMGVHGIVVSKNGTAPINSGTVKSSAGAIFSIKIARVNHLLDAIHHFQASEIPIISFTEKAPNSLYDYSPDSAGAALILGAENSGIQKKLITVSDNHIKIPMYGTIESLNVGVAAGMVLYELKKKFVQTAQ